MTDNSQTITENSQKNAEFSEENPEIVNEKHDKSHVLTASRVNLAGLIPRLPRIYPLRPIMRRVVFLSLAVFLFPVLVALVLSLAFILFCYWLVRVVIG